MEFRLLDKINTPADLRALANKDIPILAEEIRRFLINTVEAHGGHLASNLGAVEFTLAIHRVFESPKDRIIFDVGHQSYVHKLITGRRERFSALRKTGGLSGFTSRKESEHDPFGAGHSSTSVSCALGFAEADRFLGKDNYTVCVLGDGAYTGGMVHEALNNCPNDLPLIIVLNENGMSISATKGTFASYLSRVRASGRYRRWKKSTLSVLSHIPLLGSPLKKLFALIKRGVKKIIFPTNYFEGLGFYYIGPIDGNDYVRVEEALRTAKDLGKTVVVHLKTVKGKGYPPAEESPDGYHSVGKADANDSFHSALADALIGLASKDKRITAVTAAMGIGTGLDAFGVEFPERYFDVGIAEDHALTFSAGMAAAGGLPFVAIYSTFLQRGYDSIVHDVALQGLPVRLLIDRAGLSLGDGATHHGIFDVSFLSHIPGMTVLSPLTYSSLKEMLASSLEMNGPVSIRYPNSSEIKLPRSLRYYCSEINCRLLCDFDEGACPDCVFVTYGKILEKVFAARDIVEENGVNAGIIAVETLKPYGEVASIIKRLTFGARRVLYVEEGILSGGGAQNTLTELNRLGFDFRATDFRIAAIEDNFAAPAEPCELYSYVGLSPAKLAEKIMEK